jgi:hypothetical protein
MKTLNEIQGKNPFKVPDNYFEEVSRKIITAAAGTSREKAKKGLYRRLRPLIGIAASLAIFALLGYGAVKIFIPADRNDRISELSMEQFPESYLNDIDIPMLEENAGLSFVDSAIPDISKTEIIDYLLLENIDSNEIYELL